MQLYYPKIEFDVIFACARNQNQYNGVCKATYTSRSLSSDEGLGRKFGQPISEDQCNGEEIDVCPCSRFQFICRIQNQCLFGYPGN